MEAGKDRNPLISIIIPVYNGEKYIGECIRSVCAQTWKKTEILVVDDGSTDETAKHVSMYADRDPRIRLIRLSENRQLFHARLAGIEAAEGDYVLSVDSDDRISEDYVEQLLLSSLKTDADLVICDHLVGCDEDGNMLARMKGIPGDRKYLVPVEKIEEEYYRNNEGKGLIDQSYVVFWSKLYRRDLVRRALLWLRKVERPVLYTEDVLYTGVFLHFAQRAVFTCKGTYFYRNHTESVMHGNLPERLGKMTMDQLETLYFLDTFLKRTGADDRLLSLFEAWKQGLWRFLEFRYNVYRTLAWADSKNPSHSGRIWKELWDTDEYDHSLTLQDLAWATMGVEGTAIVCGENRLSYREFHRITSTIALFLMKHGLKSGDVAAIHMHRDERLLLAMFGIIKAGAAYLVLNTDWPGHRLDYVVHDSGACFVISDHADHIYGNACAYAYDDMLKEETVDTDASSSELRKRMLHPGTSDVAALYYTSGSTGKPKGVILSHANMVDSTLPLKSNACIREGAEHCTGILDVVNAGFMASVLTYGPSLYSGGKHVLVRNEDLERLIPVAGIMREEKVDFILMTPSVMTALLTVEAFTRQLAHVREITLCGEAFSQQLADTLTGLTKEGTVINNLYGTTEAAVGLACVNVRGRRVTMGVPFANTEVFAEDKEGNRLPDGQSGQLCVKGLRVAPGYHGLPELTEEKFYTDQDGIRVYRTGDLGLMNEQGEIEFLGRNDRMVKLNGVRFELPEVEYHLLKQPYIREAAVKVEKIGGRDQLCAVFVSDEPVSGKRIREDLEKVVPSAMIPTVCNQVEAMPFTERGKIDYDRLVILPPDLPEDRTLPSDEAEEMICRIFADVLEVDHVGAGASFTELGGNSLKAYMVLSRLEEHGVSASLQELLQYPTPRSLSAVIRRHLPEGRNDKSVSGIRKDTELREDVREETAFLPLPDELRSLSDEEDVLEILPVNSSTMAYLFMKEQGITDRQNVVRVKMTLSGYCPEEDFLRRIQSLMDHHPSLRSSFTRDANGGYWQVFYKRKTAPVYFRDLRGFSRDAADRLLAGFWQVMEENGETEAFAAGCFPLPDSQTALLLRLEHTICDGMSLSVIENELASPETAVPGEDDLLSYRHRHIRAAKHITEKDAAYFTPGHPLIKSTEPLSSGGSTKQEKLVLSRSETEALMKKCSSLGVTVYCYVQYTYGTALLSLINKREGSHANPPDGREPAGPGAARPGTAEEIWLLHLDSGRLPSDEKELHIVGNLMNGIPVRIRSNMTPGQLQEDLIHLSEIQGLSDSDLLYQHDWSGIYEGIISKDFGEQSPMILQSELLESDELLGNHMYMKEGCLHMVFHHVDDPQWNGWYQSLIRQMLHGLRDSMIQTITTDEFQMDYFRFGRGEEALVILPGLSVQSVMKNVRAAEKAYERLTDDFTIYLFDRRKDPPDMYSIRDMARDTVQAIRAAGLDRFSLMGVSQGGMIAMTIAIHNPEMVKKLVLCSTSSCVGEEQNMIAKEWIRLAEKKDVEGLYLKFGEAVYSKDMFEPLRKLLTEEAKSVTEEELQHFIIFVKSIYGFNVLDELDQITCPVLLLGSEDDYALGAAASYQIADRLNKRLDFEFYIYRGYGHAAYAFAPDYTDRIHAFFRKSEQSANNKRHIEYTSQWG